MCGSNVLAFLSWFLLNFKIFEFKLMLNYISFKSATPDSVVAPRVIHLLTASQRHTPASCHTRTRWHVTRDTWRLAWISSASGTNTNSDFMIGFMYIILLVMLLIDSLYHLLCWTLGWLGDINCAIKMLVSANGDICHTRARPIQIFPPLMNTLRMAQRWN